MIEITIYMCVIILKYSLLYRIYNMTTCMYVCVQILFNTYFIRIVNGKVISVKDWQWLKYFL